MAKANRLTDEQRDEIRKAVEAGEAYKDLAKRFSVSTWTIGNTVNRYHQKAAARKNGTKAVVVKRRTGRLSSRDIEALNADIADGMNERELRAKYGITPKTAKTHMRKHGLNGNGHEAKPLSSESIERLMGVLGRLAQKHPSIFSELNIMQRLAKYPDILLEVM